MADVHGSLSPHVFHVNFEKNDQQLTKIYARALPQTRRMF